ncbi:MAG: hypothetical protein LBR80_11220 [Deltaproteobacteria bacterium]|nr:hypothetical protein [Deltaproteobacteria bacterium]
MSENGEIAAERNAAESVLRKSVRKKLAHFVEEDKARIVGIISDVSRGRLAGHSWETFACLVLQAFLLRVMNGSDAVVERDYANGRGWVNLCMIYMGLRYSLELKIKGVQPARKASGNCMAIWTSWGCPSAGW